MENQVNKSRYKVAFSETAGRVAIVDKYTNEDLETFADNIPEELLVQRMLEVRQEEVQLTQLTQGTSLNSDIVTSAGEPAQLSGDIII